MCVSSCAHDGTCVPAHSVTGLPVTAVLYAGCSRFQGEGQGNLSKNLRRFLSYCLFTLLSSDQCSCASYRAPMLQVGDACGREDGNSGILLDSVKYLSFEIFTDLHCTCWDRASPPWDSVGQRCGPVWCVHSSILIVAKCIFCEAYFV